MMKTPLIRLGDETDPLVMDSKLAKTELFDSIERQTAPNTDTSAGSRKTVIGSCGIA
ncbi:hypothetical protein [Sodalinema gerasimenkoae]|uniref:hypothetical protein n=1 Tax=Sodalinema gerasimenkoae TaxID=2862348 RepID=UPI00135983FD|nr:hypothetical protein [Sodalinema gerasimenkoae]